MSDVRQVLIDAGWRQGAILAPGPFGHPDAFGFLVLNQTCDCINPDFGKEPHLELLPLEKVTGKSDSRLKNGQNPRQIHFLIQENGKDMWVNAKITEIFQFDRTEHASLAFASGCALSQTTLDDLIRWRAQRYLRPAFPDSFEKAYRPIAGRFGGMIASHESDIDSLLISISPPGEIEAGDCYEIQLHLMVPPSVMGQPVALQPLKSVAEEIEQLFAASPSFDSPKCRVTCLDEMSLWNARKFLDFSRYDHFSFGREEQAPENDAPA